MKTASGGCGGSERCARRFSIPLLALAVCIAVALATGSAVNADDEERWGPFRGRVVDADSGAPVPGAVVYLIWLEVTLNPFRPYHDFYDARVAVTDGRGAYEIPRRPTPFRPGRILGPYRDYIAPGYILVDVASAPDGGQLFLMRDAARVSPERRSASAGHGYYDFIPKARRGEVLATINAARRQMNLPPFQTLGGVP